MSTIEEVGLEFAEIKESFSKQRGPKIGGRYFHYPQELKAKAIELCNTHKHLTVSEIAERLNISESALGKWCKKGKQSYFHHPKMLPVEIEDSPITEEADSKQIEPPIKIRWQEVSLLFSTEDKEDVIKILSSLVKGDLKDASSFKPL